MLIPDILRNCGKLLLAFLSTLSLQAAAPIFIEKLSLTNDFIELNGQNNAGDLILSISDDGTSGSTAYNHVPAVARGSSLINLYPRNVTNIGGAFATGLSQVRGDGGIYITGTAVMKDGFWRAALWDVAADGTVSFRTMPNIILPEDSSRPGEQARGYGIAVNTSGIVVGSGESYLAGVATVWPPPYGLVRRYLLSTGSSFDAIREDGLLLANGVEFDHGGSKNRYAAAVLFEGGMPTEIPLLNSAPETLYPNSANSLSGEWVAGRELTSDGSVAFAWKVGTSGSHQLPTPAGIPAEKTRDLEAHSINTRGHAVGYANGDHPVLWHYADGEHRAFAFNELLPAEPFANYFIQRSIFINDQSDVAFTVRGSRSSRLKVFRTLNDGYIQFTSESSWADEGGTVEFKLKLARAPGNASPVSVQYHTADDSAVAPVHYTSQSGTLTWAGHESGEKTIAVPLKDNLTLDPLRSFKLVLSNPFGAQLAPAAESNGYITEPYQIFSHRNQMLAGFSMGTAVLQTEKEAILKFEREGNSDGAVTFTNFQAFGFTAQEGIDFELPDNLHLSWAAGDSGIKTIAIPMLNSGQPATEIKSFSISAEGKFENSEMTAQLYANVLLVPAAADAQPVIDAAALQNTSESLILSISAVQGALVQLEKSLQDLASGWISAAEGTSEDGEVRLEVPIDPTERNAFFRVKVTP